MNVIQTPHDAALAELCSRLRELSPQLRSETDWPGEQLAACADAGVFRWFLDRQWGGFDWPTADIMAAYMQLSASCLTTTFILTQFAGACRRIAGSDNAALREELIPRLITGESFATVGISHLTTSGQHHDGPALRATPLDDGSFRLDGKAPWATGASAADFLVVGASLEDGRQLLAVLQTDQPGVEIPPPTRLVGMSATQTGPVLLDGCVVTPHRLVAGPVEEVMRKGVGAGTGGVQTSALAVGLAKAAIQYLLNETSQRPELSAPTRALESEATKLEEATLAAAAGHGDCSLEELRGRANSLALRSAQSALAAAKGTGYVEGHPVGRWCCEALLFLVWSCPQPVVAATLCELAGITD